MISEINREEEELKCIQQAQSRCDFSEFAQQPEVAALGPQLGGNGRSWRSTLQGRQGFCTLKEGGLDGQVMAHPDNEVLIGK